MTLTTYLINSIDNGNYNITFFFDDKSQSTQIINFGALQDKGALESAIKQYIVSYVSGMPATIRVPPDILALVGKSEVPA